MSSACARAMCVVAASAALSVAAGCGGGPNRPPAPAPTPAATAAPPAPTRSDDSADAQAVASAVRKTFADYRAALLAEDGAAAAAVVDSKTIRWYQDAVDDALHASPSEPAKRNFMMRFTVMKMRLEFDRKRLDMLDGRKVFALSIQRGWTSKRTVENVERLHAVEVTGDGMARATIPEAPDQPLFYFLREEAAWKLALWKTFPAAEAALQQMIKESGLSEKRFVIRIFAATSTRQVDDAVYDKLLAGPPE